MKRDQQQATPEHLRQQLKQLGAVLRHLRQSRSLTVQDAAARAGVSVPTARRAEQGHAGVALGSLMRYLDALYPRATLRDALDDSSAIRQAALEASLATRRRPRRKDLAGLDF